MKDLSICKVGIYAGTPWAEMPLNYLIWAGNNNKGSFRDMCRAEVVRRYAIRGEPDPWEYERISFGQSTPHQKEGSTSATI